MASNLKWPPALALLLVAAMVGITSAGNIAVYWGQDGREGSLADACNSGNYAYVMIGFLTTFGNQRTPILNLAGHCTNFAPNGGCAFLDLTSEIQGCQSLGIKVLLSLGGSTDGTNVNYGLSSADDANSVAQYLWDNYLGGSGSSSRPLGSTQLDGIDFDIENGQPAHYDDLARALKAKGQVLLTAAPQCVYPDASLGQALSTVQFDNVWIQFYNNPCQYADGNKDALVNAWGMWTSSITAGSFYLGVPASKNAPGYIPPGDLTQTVLPAIKDTNSYGGIMVWNRYTDGLNDDYSGQVKGSV